MDNLLKGWRFLQIDWKIILKGVSVINQWIHYYSIHLLVDFILFQFIINIYVKVTLLENFLEPINLIHLIGFNGVSEFFLIGFNRIQRFFLEKNLQVTQERLLDFFPRYKNLLSRFGNLNTYYENYWMSDNNNYISIIS